MKNSFTQSMSWLHTWAGLVFGWLLFAIFLTGTLAVFDKELNHWMQPEIAASEVSQADAAERAIAYLQAHEPKADNWGISLPTERSLASDASPPCRTCVPSSVSPQRSTTPRHHDARPAPGWAA